MLWFWLIVVALLVVALLFILPSLFAARKPNDRIARDALNVEVFKDQMRELENDLRIGQLSQEQFDQAKVDLEKSLLEGIGDEAEASGNANEVVNSVISKASGWVLLIAVPLVSIVLYQTLGGGKGAFDPQAAQPQASAEGHNGAKVEEMIATLKDRLEKDPNDSQGWAMLGRSYYYLQRFPEASQSYAKAVELTKDTPDADILADYADALALVSDKSLAGKPTDLVKMALVVNPKHPKSLWLAGTAAYEVKDYKAALEYWQRLYTLLPPDSQNAQMVRGNLEEVSQILGQPLAEVKTAATGAPSVTGKVTLAANMRGKVSPEDTVFVFARASEGPRMPLAIVRKQVKDLPLEFTLDDTTAMNPQMKMSNFPQVVVGARVSKSGGAMPQPGDLEGSVGPVNSSGGAPVSIEINSVVGQ